MLVARDILEKAAEQNGQFNEDTPNKLDTLCKPLNEEEIKKKKAAQLGDNYVPQWWVELVVH